MKLIKSLIFAALAALAVTLPAAATDEANHEVWMIDQSNGYDSDANGTLDSGGTLYIYDGKDLVANPPEDRSGRSDCRVLGGRSCVCPVKPPSPRTMWPDSSIPELIVD